MARHVPYSRHVGQREAFTQPPLDTENAGVDVPSQAGGQSPCLASAPSARVPVGVRGWASFVASNSTNMYRREKDALEMCVKVVQKDV